MCPAQRVLRLDAVLDGGDPGYRRPRGYERALRGTFDADCTRVGDYMVGPRGVLFIASLQPLAHPLCVLTNAVLHVLRPQGPGVQGLTSYGGVREPELATILAGWPGQVLGTAAASGGELPDDAGPSRWSVLLPPTPVPLRDSDLLRDETTNRRFLVVLAERSELGWRLDARSLGA